MKIVIGADHRGVAYKTYLKTVTNIGNQHIEWIDVGADSDERTDYPRFAQKLCITMKTNCIDHGILICGSGVGMAVAANRYPHIYAALVWNNEIARLAVAHDNANVLVIPASFVSQDQLISIVETWLATQFLGGRYQERIDMIDAMKCE
ncbi:MAG TPA: RpiB/LacA/LacB family sugar-phosphate isomerase [Candidatus Babeliales bacterium]|nr:RpiB/LacA/LacB family sugar-phosphate isomerase [Candidatus Babeliales bacterium]